MASITDDTPLTQKLWDQIGTRGTYTAEDRARINAAINRANQPRAPFVIPTPDRKPVPSADRPVFPQKISNGAVILGLMALLGGLGFWIGIAICASSRQDD